MFKDFKKILRYNGKNIFEFELFYKIITIFIISPLFINLFNITMKLNGFTYITRDNIISFISKPLTIILMIFIIFIISILSIFESINIIILIDASYQRKIASLKNVLSISLQRFINIFKKSNIRLLLLSFLITIVLNTGILSSFIINSKIKDFILNYINNYNLFYIIYIVINIILILYICRYIYSIHYYLLENKSVKESMIKSKNLSNSNKIIDIFIFIVLEFLINIIYLLMLFIGILIIFIVSISLNKIGVSTSYIKTSIWLFMALSFIICLIISTPISYMGISSLFYIHKKNNNEEIIHIKLNEKNIVMKNKTWDRFRLLIILLLIISGTIYNEEKLKGKYNLNIEYLKTLEITGHRGSSKDYPENTMIAFSKAKEMGANWIELDVLQTKDQKVIVMHDSSFKRTTGLNKKSYEITYDEVKKLDAGSYKGKDFKDTKIPLLEDVISWAKDNNIRLNIEIKPTGHEIEFEKQVVNIVNKYDFKDLCVVTSQDYNVITKVKDYDNSITTVYVMPKATGDVTKYDKADSYSIEASSITRDMVIDIHNQGKEIYGWTADDKETINKMIDLRVDNIITDDIVLAKELVSQHKTGGFNHLIIEFKNFINNNFI